MQFVSINKFIRVCIFFILKDRSITCLFYTVLSQPCIQFVSINKFITVCIEQVNKQDRSGERTGLHIRTRETDCRPAALRLSRIIQRIFPPVDSR